MDPSDPWDRHLRLHVYAEFGTPPRESKFQRLGIRWSRDASWMTLPPPHQAPAGICDAYGAGFFFIPGTGSCLKIGGLVMTELRGFDPSFSISGTNFYANGTPHPGAGFVPSVSQYSNARSRDAFSFATLGRVEFDTRTHSPWGALRSFVRVDAYYGSGQQAATGSLGSLANTFNTTAGTSAPRETTILN